MKRKESFRRRHDDRERQLGDRMSESCFFECPVGSEELSVIAEIRKSPSAGEISPSTSALEQAREYCNAGTDAMSILTDEKFSEAVLMTSAKWMTSFDNIASITTIRKDYMSHPIQV